MLPISVCIICKNEESHIQKCLSHLSAFAWEIVVVDTGSTDWTVEIASAFTPCIHHFTWCNDFSAARNYALSQATHDWILSVDCDEYMDSADITEFAHWFESNCIPHPEILGRFALKNHLEDNDSSEYTNEYVTRFFNRNYYHFEGAIHEQLQPLFETDRTVIDMPLCFQHVGYITQDTRLAKANRNIALLQEEIAHSTPSCYLYYQLGQCYFSIQDYAAACNHFEEALFRLPQPFPDYVRTLIVSYGYSLLELKHYQKALMLPDEDFYEAFSQCADYIFLVGLIYMNNGLFQQAIDEFLKATALSDCRAVGTNSFKAFYNIGVIYECKGNTADACSYYQKCGQYLPALNRLEALEHTP